jgi:hypothetical protein
MPSTEKRQDQTPLFLVNNNSDGFMVFKLENNERIEDTSFKLNDLETELNLYFDNDISRRHNSLLRSIF